MKFQYRNILISLALGFGFSAAANAQDFSIKDCKVEFKTVGAPVKVEINGTSGAPCTGKFSLDGGAVKSSLFEMPLDKLDTGIELRNKHLRENYLKVSEFPKAAFKLTSADKAGEIATGGGEASFKGKMKLHGKVSDVEGTYKVSGDNVNIKMPLDLRDYGVEAPSFMGVTVVDKIYLDINFNLAR
jgi:hypothetical protein